LFSPADSVVMQRRQFEAYTLTAMNSLELPVASRQAVTRANVPCLCPRLQITNGFHVGLFAFQPPEVAGNSEGLFLQCHKC
jgi:hypothetical protein